MTSKSTEIEKGKEGATMLMYLGIKKYGGFSETRAVWYSWNLECLYGHGGQKTLKIAKGQGCL